MKHKYEVSFEEFGMKFCLKQANGAVWITSGEISILVTVVSSSL